MKSHSVGASLVAAVLVSALAIALAGPALASDPPGNNGTIKIHEQGTPSGTESNDPKVCIFNVEGFGFDAEQSGYINFDVQGGDAPTGTASGGHAFGPTDSSGYYATVYFKLDPGHYKATLYGKFGDTVDFKDVKAKSKVFKVECEDTQAPATTPPPSNPPSSAPPSSAPPSNPPSSAPPSSAPPSTPPSTPTPTPAGGGGAATPTPTPAGAIGGATATPVATLPPTNTLESTAQPAGTVPLVLLVLVAIGSIVIGATVLRPRPVRTRR